MIKEFRDFITRGNVLDLAVAVIIGGAFGRIVTSFVNDLLMPPIGRLLGHTDFSSLYLDLSGGTFASLEEARKAGAPVVAYGAFLNAVIDFLIVAVAVFLVVRVANRLQRLRETPPAPAAPTTRECPFCCLTIPIKATRCPHCTSPLNN